MLSTIEIEQIEKSEQSIVQRLYAEYKIFAESPYVDSYLSALNQLNKWNEELRDRPVAINENEKDKAFERALLYLKSRDELLESLDATRNRMSEKQHEEVQAVVNKKHKDKIVL